MKLKKFIPYILPYKKDITLNIFFIYFIHYLVRYHL